MYLFFYVRTHGQSLDMMIELLDAQSMWLLYKRLQALLRRRGAWPWSPRTCRWSRHRVGLGTHLGDHLDHQKCSLLRGKRGLSPVLALQQENGSGECKETPFQSERFEQKSVKLGVKAESSKSVADWTMPIWMSRFEKHLVDRQCRNRTQTAWWVRASICCSPNTPVYAFFFNFLSFPVRQGPPKQHDNRSELEQVDEMQLSYAQVRSFDKSTVDQFWLKNSRAKISAACQLPRSRNWPLHPARRRASRSSVAMDPSQGLEGPTIRRINTCQLWCDFVHTICCFNMLLASEW